MPAPVRVVLVHGLWYGRPGMWPLARRLERRGWRCERFGYPSVRTRPADNARRLADFVASLEADTVHLVGHSLGGLLILQCLKLSHAALPPGRVVLLGSPLAGSEVARRLARNRRLGASIGRSAELLSPGIEGLPAGREIGAIAGTAPVGAGRLVARLEPPHDGTVTVAETRAPGLAAQLELPVSHTGLVFSPAVAEAVDRFLHSGRFGP